MLQKILPLSLRHYGDIKILGFRQVNLKVFTDNKEKTGLLEEFTFLLHKNCGKIIMA